MEVDRATVREETPDFLKKPPKRKETAREETPTLLKSEKKKQGTAGREQTVEKSLLRGMEEIVNGIEPGNKLWTYPVLQVAMQRVARGF